MGKRKFKKPDDSESEYEWEESEPKAYKKTTELPKDANSQDLSSFLDQYTTKSRKDTILDRKQEEKSQEEKKLKERMCVHEEGGEESFKIDNNWLKRVYNRMRERCRETGEDLVSVLRERYDERTIGLMERLCGGRSHSTRDNRGRGMSREDPRGDRRSRDNCKEGERSMEDNRGEGKSKKYFSGEKRPREDYMGGGNAREESPSREGGSVDVEERFVTIVDLNEASASLMRAEIAGNINKVGKLKKRIEILREAQRRNLKIRLTRPKKEVEEKECEERSVKSLKSGKMLPYVETGKRFIGPSCVSSGSGGSAMETLRREEDGINAYEVDWEFAKIAGRSSVKQSRYEETGEREYSGVDCDSSSSRRPQKKRQEEEDRRPQKEEAQKKRQEAQVKECKKCYRQLPKHLVLSKGEYFCLCVPADLGLVDCHWQLLPLCHVEAASRLDEDSWQELQAFKKQIANFYSKELKAEDSVFMETAINLDSHPHMAIDCIPLSVDGAERSLVSYKVYFKKAIEEAKSEWCQNKKIMDMPEADIRRTVPKHFPYFSVEFSSDSSGLAFVIDDERKFDRLFGLEIVGSLLDKSLIEIKNRKEKDFSQQAAAVLKAEKRWKSYDLWKRSDSDSD